MAIDKKLIDQLLTDYKRPEDINWIRQLLAYLKSGRLELWRTALRSISIFRWKEMRK